VISLYLTTYQSAFESIIISPLILDPSHLTKKFHLFFHGLCLIFATIIRFKFRRNDEIEVGPSLGTDKGIADGSSLGIDVGNKLGEEEGFLLGSNEGIDDGI
jgi:hypothetical protein